jgi:tetratricopeptide (TPR) repeat protein
VKIRFQILPFKFNLQRYNEANSEKLPAHLNLSACYLKLRRNNEAIDQACRALGVEPKNPKAFYRRGRAKQALGREGVDIPPRITTTQK